MRKMIFTCTMLVFSNMVKGQLYFEMGGGYGFSTASEVIDYDITTNLNSTGWTQVVTLVKGSYGAGLNYGLNVGYKMKSNISFELGTNLLNGHKFSGTSSYNSSSLTEESKWTWQGRMLRFNPKIGFIGNGTKIVPFAKVGFVLGVNGKIRYSETESSSDGDSRETAFELYENLAFGFSGEFGATYTIKEKWGISLSAQGIGMNWAPGRLSYTKEVVNGVDQLPSMSTIDKEIVFVEEITQSSSTPPNSNSPDEYHKMYFPFSSFGVSLQIRYNL
ncbi:MAG: outer membrane beta-barrel protein [Fluviicola sp.]|jgi:hypothetical protein